jgi:hypothetical protein
MFARDGGGRKRRGTAAVVIVGVLATGFLVNLLMQGQGLFIGRNSQAQQDYAGPSTRRALAAESTDIFIGRVVEVTRTEELPTSSPNHVVPITYYAVDVVDALKGNVTGRVEVKQEGGDGDFNAEYGDGPLRRGEDYLFLTRPARSSTRSARFGQPLTIFAPGAGNTRITSDRHRAELVAEVERATNDVQPRRSRDRD